MLNSKAYTEVYYIINQMSDEMRSKIPDNIIKNIKARMDTKYMFSVPNNDFENVELLEDTEKILSVLYTDYFASEEERKVILNKEKLIYDEKKNNEYKITKINDIFKNNKENETKKIQNDINEKGNKNISIKKLLKKLLD